MNLKELIKSTEKYNEKVLYKSEDREILYKDFHKYIESLGTALINTFLKKYGDVETKSKKIRDNSMKFTAVSFNFEL